MFKKIIIMLLILIVLIVLGVVLYLQHPLFGAQPTGQRLERILRSPNYRDGAFQNLSETPQNTSNKSMWKTLWDIMFQKTENLTPDHPFPTQKTDLFSLSGEKNQLVWFGHSAYFMFVDGKKVLVDPTLVSASPVSFFGQAFTGSQVYHPEDIPAVDYLIISHDHYDHLDYYTIKEIKDRIKTFIVPLGVGAHLERRGVESSRIIELDRNEESDLDSGFKITALPARHFSGRTFKRNQTLWASFMLQTPTETIYIGGDGGYDPFFKEIGQRRTNITLAIIENGQYNQDRKYIHLLPEQLPQLVADLNPKKVLTVHNSKYSLARHDRREPLRKVSLASQASGFQLITPMIGQLVNLDDQQSFQQWREEDQEGK